MKLYRRQFLSLLAITLAAPMVNAAGEKLPALLQLSGAQRQTLDILCDLILPATETPGATATGTAEWISMMMSESLTSNWQTLMINGLEAFAATSIQISGQALQVLPREQQSYLLGIIDGDTFSQSPPRDAAHGRSRQWYLLLKHLVIAGHYTSKIGASSSLDINPVPGSFDPQRPIIGVDTRTQYQDRGGVPLFMGIPGLE